MRTQIVSAAHQSFIGGLHLASIVAALIVLIAVAGVVIWLPARAIDQEQGGDTAPVAATFRAAAGTGRDAGVVRRRDSSAVALDRGD